MSAQPDIDPTQANLSRLALYFGVGRDTIRKKIELSGVQPSASYGNTRYYKISDAARACFGSDETASCASDPADMKPSEQRDYWMAKQKELEYKQSISEFLHQNDVRDTFRELAETLSDKIQSYPDILERDEGLAPKDVDRMVKLCDKLSVAMHEVFAESC